MTAADEYFVGTCSHVNESAEMDACGRRRLAWLWRIPAQGLRVSVALPGNVRAAVEQVLHAVRGA
jgi:hypothetical protein